MARAVNPRFRASKYLCLPPATGELPAHGGIIVAAVSPPVPKPIEHAGHAYQQRLRSTHCTAAAKAENAAAAAAATSAKSSGATKGAAKQAVDDDEYALKRKLATDGDDLYELLELGDKRWHATADEIKKSFRRISLLYHPDKLRHKVSHLGEEAIAETENHFKKVMKAYDILSDKKKRASYDSIDDVDDSIPSEKEINDKNFYKKMGDCFALNARWSVSDRVPELGDDSTPIEQVHKFYDFWYSFKTWRDFSFDLEYNTDQAECREEKRWMDRQNAKHIKARKLEESARMRRLVDLGYKNDPRIKREKESMKAKKEAQKEARRKQREEVEEQKRAEEEKARLEQERKAMDDKEKRALAKKEKDAARKLMRKARQKLRAVARDLDLVSEVAAITAIEKMCSDGDVNTINAFADKLKQIHEESSRQSTAVPDPRISNITEIVEDVLKNGIDSSSCVCSMQSRAEAPLTPSPADKTDVQIPEKPKTCSGISTTTKEARVLVPVASEIENDKVDKKIVNGVRTQNGVKSSEASKNDGSVSARDTGSSNSAWTTQEMSLLSKGLAKFPGGTRNRWERLAHYVGTRSEQEVLTKVNAMRPSKLQNGKASLSASSTKIPQPAKELAPEPSKAKANGVPADPAQVPGKPPNILVFTAKQQQQLEAAMKKFPGKLGASRWVKIAAEVSGRSATECEERCKELISYYRAKKSNAT